MRLAPRARRPRGPHDARLAPCARPVTDIGAWWPCASQIRTGGLLENDLRRSGRESAALGPDLCGRHARRRRGSASGWRRALSCSPGAGIREAPGLAAAARRHDPPPRPRPRRHDPPATTRRRDPLVATTRRRDSSRDPPAATTRRHDPPAAAATTRRCAYGTASPAAAPKIEIVCRGAAWNRSINAPDRTPTAAASAGPPQSAPMAPSNSESHTTTSDPPATGDDPSSVTASTLRPSRTRGYT